MKFITEAQDPKYKIEYDQIDGRAATIATAINIDERITKFAMKGYALGLSSYECSVLRAAIGLLIIKARDECKDVAK